MINTIPHILQKLFQDDSDPSKIRGLCRAFAVVLGALHTYAAVQSQSMNADGIAYLDIADAYFRADWATAINPVWSPLYSWLLGLANFIFKPPMQWEFPTVQIVNFFIYLFAVASFEFMWHHVRGSSQSEGLRLPDRMWWLLGYLLFIWITLSLIQIWSVTPDMLMAGLVFLASGLIAQIRSGNDDYRIFLSLGLILGLGYLSKTFMFSLAPVFLILAWLVQKLTRTSLYKTLLAAGVFVLVSVPFILLISSAKGRLTIGEAGTVTFLRYVSGMPFPHWQGNPDTGIVPIHPSRVIHESPAVYEFGEPIGGTYPISLDPSYWYEGIKPRFEFGGLFARLLSSSLVYGELFLQTQGILLGCVLAFYVMGKRQQFSISGMLERWAFILPSVIAFGLYGMVLVQSRYVGIFVFLFWADLLANIRLSDAGNNKYWLNVLSAVAAVGLLANIVMFNLDGFKRLNPSLSTGSILQTAPPAKPLEVARALQELGIHQGDRVGVIGYAYDSFWARLARVKIVAEMFEAQAIDDLWRGDESLRQSVLEAFADAAVDAIVAEYVPDDVVLKDWHRVGNSNYYIYVFAER